MKSITEFASFTLANGLKAKAALTEGGKSAEEIQTSLGETFKYEGDKLKHFVSALDVAAANPEKLRRVLVASLAEGEATPAKAIKVEETVYIPEFLIETKMVPQKAEAGKFGRGGGKGGDRKQGPKSSPWGMSPEEKAAKLKGSQAAKAAATAK